MCLSGALVWLTAATAAGAQDNGCAGGSHSQIAKQLAQAKARAHAAGCTGLFNLFQPHAVCTGLTEQVSSLEARLRQVTQQQRPTPQRRSNSVLHFSFQGRAVPDCSRPPARSERVVCVRLCDGYFFPVNHGIKQKNLAKDEQKCLSQYPEGRAALYIDRSGGENVAAMVSLDGKLKYGDQPFAFAFQQRFDPACPRPGAHLAEAARSTAKGSTESAPIVHAAIKPGESSAGPKRVRLVGPPYAYYFPERVSDASTPAASLAPTAAAAVRAEIERVSTPGTAGVFSDEQALVAGD
jgi:hypothetical protein